MLSFGIRIHEKKKRKTFLDPTLEKEEGFQFQTSQGMTGKTAADRGDNPLVGCSANPMILILMRGSLPSKLRKTNKKKTERCVCGGGERGRYTRTHTLTQSYMRIYALMQ